MDNDRDNTFYGRFANTIIKKILMSYDKFITLNCVSTSSTVIFYLKSMQIFDWVKIYQEININLNL